MSKFTDLVDRILNEDVSWENRTGKEVEDFICLTVTDFKNRDKELELRDKERDVHSMLYDNKKQILTLYNEDGGIVASGSVSPAEPTYNHSLTISQILIDGTNVTNQEKIQCKLGSKIILKVDYALTAENPLSGEINHLSGKQKLFINIGSNGYVEIPEGIVSNPEILEIDITKYYNSTTVSPVSLKVITLANIGEDRKQVIATTDKPIAVLNPRINYGSDDYIVNGFTKFDVIEGGGLNYNIRYTVTTNGETSPLVRGSDLNVSLTIPGLNIIDAYLVLSDNESIASDHIKVQLINIKDLGIIKSPLFAINEINNHIVNWEYSKLYKITSYFKGIKLDALKINTKLTNTADKFDVYFDKIKEVSLIGNESGMYQEDICYFFGMDVSGNLSTNLVVNVNDQSIISFEDTTQMEVDNDNIFTYTKGYTYAFDQFDPENSNIITKDVTSKLELPDGLVQEDTLTSFRVSARNSEIPVLELDLESTLTNAGFTFELDFKSSNISDPTKPVLTIGRFVLFPTELNWQFTSSEEGNDSVDKTSRSALFQEDARTHLLIEVVPGFKAAKREIPVEATSISNRTINIVRIFINGCIDREFKYNTLQDFHTDGFKLKINPSASDIDIYGLRVYNKALSFQELSNNYISTISNVEDKIKIKDGNDIVKVDTNNDTYISYNEAKKKYNTILYIIPAKHEYPHQFNMIKGEKIKGCTVFVNYVNSDRLPYKYDEKRIAKCSGRFHNMELKGQGTSAMKYFWYNIAIGKGTFTSDACYDPVNLEYKAPAPEDNLLYESKKYYMPEDLDDSIGISKICGKTNYASSQQSHKIGATRAFHDLWDACVSKSDYDPKEIRGRKAVLEDPFLVFYIESDKEDVSNFTPADVQAVDDASIKFATFQTWGSAKGDKATTGYNEDEDLEFLFLEGAENNGKLCNFLTPWLPDCTILNKETFKTKELSISYDKGEKVISYNLKDSWDVDFGLTDDENHLVPGAQKTMDRFNEAYNMCYLHTINLLPYKETYSLNDPRNNQSSVGPDGTIQSALDVTKKYYITNSRYNDAMYFPGKQWDVFRYDAYSNMWVPAGLPVMETKMVDVPNEGSDGGTHQEERTVLKVHPSIVSPEGAPVYDYEVFNLKEQYKAWGGQESDSIENFKKGFIADFKKKFGDYFHVDDLVYHQAYIKLFAGTDNRAKNTYFKMFDSKSKIQMWQDDLDTILATDNRGLQKKPYFLLEPSLEEEEQYQKMWGGASAFFELIDVAYRDEITNMLKSMLEQFKINYEPSIQEWMLKYFYYVLEYFPATAYNHTARLAYESAQIYFDNRSDFGRDAWQNNGQDPISQAHGSCVESEKEFMKKRLIMFLSQVQISNMFGREAMGIDIKADEDAGSSSSSDYTIDITPYQRLYMGYNVGSNPALYNINRQSENIPFTARIKIEPSTPLYSVLGNRYIKKFDNFSKIVWNKPYNLVAKRLVEMVAYDANAEKKPFQPSLITLNTPVLTKLDLRGIKSLGQINLDSDHTPKLTEVYLTGTSIDHVDLPKGSRLETVYLPKTLKKLEIINNPGLKVIDFEGTKEEQLNNLESAFIDCSKCGAFKIDEFCALVANKTKFSKLTLRNANHLKMTEATLISLLNTELDVTGIIDIVLDIKGNDLLDIKFNTLQRLVNKFGDITSDSNRLKINFKSSNIDSFTTASEISVFYQNGQSGDVTFGNLFAVNVDHGNNIKIEKGTNQTNPDVDAYVSIKYSLNCSTSIAEVNSQTGVITLHQESSEPATATITLTRVDGHIFTRSTKVNFTWKAPEIGDFAYADGTFESSYNINKTMVGLVYARDMDPSGESGTVYIVGKEYVGGVKEPQNYLVGYADDGDISSNKDAVKELSKVTEYLTRLNVTRPDSKYGDIYTNDASKAITYDNLTVSKYDDDSNINFKGKADTQLYIERVNDRYIKTVKNVRNSDSPTGIPGIADIINPYVKAKSGNMGTSYYIDSLTDLNGLINVLPNTTTDTVLILSHINILSCVVFPYFYGAYLYEPTIKEGESLSSDYAKNKWFCPSAYEMLRIIYYRGISANGDNFTDDQDIHKEIQPLDKLSLSGLSSKKESLRIPIFSKALSAMNAVGATGFPSVWKDIAGDNNLTSSTNSSNLDANYSYQRSQDYSDRHYHTWVLGSKGGLDYDTYDQSAELRAWRLTSHRILPFTQRKFSKTKKK